MKRSLLALGLGLALAATAQAADIRLVIHGGAGTMAREDFTPERAAKYHEGLQQALQAGYAVLEQGGTAVDAVKAAINQMELNPNFNAGRGAVFTSEGKNELDSSIMDGKTLSAGAVAGVTNVKHPINCADLVRTKSPHVMMATKGAEEFCAKNGAETVDPKWFFTDFRYQQLQKAKEKEQIYSDARMDTVQEFLAVYDNLERAVSQVGDEDSPHKKGMEMIFHQFDEILSKMGVEKIDAVGKPFDPEKHSAVMHIEDETLGENTVADVFRQGFILGGKVLRFAVVKMAN